MGLTHRAAPVIAPLLACAVIVFGCQPKPSSAGPGPIPPPGPLAAPKPLNQVGLPVAATLAAVPADNPQTPAKLALGEKLFFDGRLSVDGTVACSTCHDPAKAFTDGRTVSIGVKGLQGQRNAPTVLNALYNSAQFWDGRAQTLEAQAGFPIINPVEMGQPSLAAATASIAKYPEYQQAFQQAFGRPPNPQDLVRAIAAYERSQVSFNAPFDRFIAGDQGAIGDEAKRGWALFNGHARCNLCHALTDTTPDPTFFIDKDFHNIGIGIIRHDVTALACRALSTVNASNTVAVDQAAIGSELSVLGRYLVTRREADIASFKTPSLRNVLMTAPYFHDGSQRTLWDVMDHYNKGDGVKNPWLDTDMRPLGLSEPDIDDMVAFLATLTSDQYRVQAAQELARQRTIANGSRTQRDTARAFGPKPVEPSPQIACPTPR